MPDRNTEFVRLLKQHERRLAAYVFTMVPDWNDAEDLVQETWVRLWEQFDQYRAGEDFGSWACTIARYLVLAYRKRTQRQKVHFSSQVIDALDVQAATDIETAERRLRILAGCIRKLSDFARDLLHRCYGRRMKIKDIARETGRSVNGVYLALSRIRRDLHDCVETAAKEGDA
jgi:RNA polymerase sigma-70 factor (ECF subfamily)